MSVDFFWTCVLNPQCMQINVTSSECSNMFNLKNRHDIFSSAVNSNAICEIFHQRVLPFEPFFLDAIAINNIPLQVEQEIMQTNLTTTSERESAALKCPKPPFLIPSNSPLQSTMTKD